MTSPPGGGSARRFEPVPGAWVLAERADGELSKARVTATSRAMDGGARFVCKFEAGGAVLHLPVEKLRRA